MSGDWIFSSEGPLPEGFKTAAITPVCLELGHRRLAEAESLLGRADAEAVAEKLGHYELDEACVRELESSGAKVGIDGKWPALSPMRWLASREAESWENLLTRLKEKGGSVAGLRLSAAQRKGFHDFLHRNHVSPGEPERLVSLARHFFFGEPIIVVLAYTGPRFPHA